MANRCKCGCGGLVKLSISNGITTQSKWCRGHHMRRSSIKKELRKRASYARQFIPEVRSKEWGNNVSKALLGKKRKPHTVEAKRKISLASKKLWQSNTHRKKMAAKMKKRWLDPIYKNKVRKHWDNEDFKKKISFKKSHTVTQQYASGERTPPWIDVVHCKVGTIQSKKGGDVSYRGSWERFFIQLLDSSKIVKSFTYQPFGIQYKFKGSNHTYFPDFLVALKNGDKWIVEIKGAHVRKDKAKFRAAYEWCNKNGYEWVVISEKPTKPLTEYLQ
jgi:hypothetical protein